MERERFTLYSSLDAGYWVVADTEHNIVIRFREHKFNKTQNVFLFDKSTFRSVDDTTPIAVYLGEMAYWLRHNHYNVAMSSLLDRRVAIGERIREPREARGISLEQMASMTRMTVGNLYRIESGKYSTKLDSLNRIADALGMKFDFQ